MTKARAKQLFVCISNEGFAASLEKRKIYLALPDVEAERRGVVRIIDESGEIPRAGPRATLDENVFEGGAGQC